MSQAALDALECYTFSEDAECAGDQADQKQCGFCKASKPLAEFSKGSNKCKDCQKDYYRMWYAKRKRANAQEDYPDEKEEELGDESEHASEPGHSHLYVMQNSRFCPGELKIGRSQDVEARRRSLQRSQNYRMLVLAVFPQAGNIEGCVHEMLSYCRVTEEAAGREWFRCSPQTAFSAIGQALGERLLAATSAGSSA